MNHKNIWIAAMLAGSCLPVLCHAGHRTDMARLRQLKIVCEAVQSRPDRTRNMDAVEWPQWQKSFKTKKAPDFWNRTSVKPAAISFRLESRRDKPGMIFYSRLNIAARQGREHIHATVGLGRVYEFSKIKNPIMTVTKLSNGLWSRLIVARGGQATAQGRHASPRFEGMLWNLIKLASQSAKAGRW